MINKKDAASADVREQNHIPFFGKYVLDLDPDDKMLVDSDKPSFFGAGIYGHAKGE